MGAIERFITDSVKDTGADEIVEALLGKTRKPDTGQDERIIRTAIREAANATRSADDVELKLDIWYD